MKSIRTLAAIALGATTALVLVTAAAAGAPLRGTFPIGLHSTFPAGTFSPHARSLGAGPE